MSSLRFVFLLLVLFHQAVSYQLLPAPGRGLEQQQWKQAFAPIAPRETTLQVVSMPRARLIKTAWIIKTLGRALKRVSISFFLVAYALMSFANGAHAAGTGGRVGGSFSRSSSPRSSGSPRSFGSPNQIRVYSQPRPIISVYGGQPRARSSFGSFAGSQAPSKSFSPSDVAVLTGTGVLFAYGLQNNLRNKDNESPLGPGATFASLTVSIDVPDRDGTTILDMLREKTKTTETTSRKGVQMLVNDGTYHTHNSQLLSIGYP
jgi:hypothetical protein